MTWTLSAFADEAGANIDDQIAASKQGNLRHIDLRNVNRHNITTLPLDEAEAVKKKLDAAGITVNMYGSPIGKIDITDDVKIDLDKLEHLARLSAIFGCRAVRMFSYFNKQKLGKDQWKQKAFDNLNRLREVAARHELVLYHENESHIFGDHPDDVLQLAELRDGKTFRLIYDFANYVRTGVDGWAIWQMFADKTDCFHFKDQRQSGEHTPMGQGDTHARRILEDAKARGWSGPCTIEPHLTHSGVVVATGSSGTGAQSLKDLTPPQTFQIAVEASHKLLQDLGIAYR